ncbi:MAG: NAD+ synthase [Xanthomonadales bacterium]|nr:Glutamine-dependent NAD(+) synthetase [Xanthomonadales bacterium]MCC6592263.1 NAD+ synthase [Xanthomonadales bacterium]MCE7930671.1 NAD+ synthase [Xanthomonadales bacterium PRO6]
MPPVHRIALVQDDFPVGAVAANLRRLKDLRQQATGLGARLLLTPELALSGYPPEDLLYRPGFQARIDGALADLADDAGDCDLLVGHPARVDGRLYNCASFIATGAVRALARKQRLPNYTVFDEKRYFAESLGATVVDHRGLRVGVLICEDAWFPEPAAAARAQGAQILLVLNASPYHQGKRAERAAVLGARALECGLPLVYCNLVGGQDDLIFDGQSMLFGADGALLGCAPAFCDHLLLVDIEPGEPTRLHAVDWPASRHEPPEAEVYRALVRATADYVRKNGFREVLLGLSGGIDSALTLAIAVDALGADAVTAVRLPSRYTSALSNDEAATQARAQGVRIETLPIEGPCQAFLDTLAPLFTGRAPDITEENLQSRCRGVLLMALSNKFGGLVLSTGNKSEMAVGYATIYGDMCGGFAPLKDVYKTQVYALARWRNSLDPAIPSAVIERAPSAELRENQTDQDSLPPYPELDDILCRFIEHDQPRAAIVAAGHDAATVARVTGLVLRNEYKRRQSAPGPRVTARSFGRDRRFPISSGYR